MKAGDKAPDFTLPDQKGKPFRLKENLGRIGTVLYFYPKDNSPVCTAQAKSFKERFGMLEDMGATVIGISADDPATHCEFASKNDLPFPLLSDTSGSVIKMYEARGMFGLLPQRITYVLDSFGIVVGKYNDMLNADPHVAQAIRMLGTIES